jgi:multidrug resistance efflux pump
MLTSHLFLLGTVAALLWEPVALAQENDPKSKNDQGTLANGRLASKPSSSNPIQQDNRNQWMKFDRCPVFAIESVEIPSQETGTIESLHVEEGDLVQAKHVLGKLDAKIAELEKHAAGQQAQVAAAEANDDSEIRLVEAFVDEAQLQLDIYEELSSRGTSGDSELRQKQLALSQAKVRVVQAQAVKQQKDLRAKLAQTSVLLASQKMDRLTLKTPISGYVARIDHRPGEWVQAGVPIVKIIRLDELRVDCFIDIQQIDPVQLIGQSVRIIASRGKSESTFAGKITSFDADVSATGSIRLHATVQNQMNGKNWLLLPGMTVSMQLSPPQ